MTNWIALGAVGVAALAIAMLAALTMARARGYRRASRDGSSPVTEFDPARYAPMVRLMTGEDLEFLRQQNPCGPQAAARWDRARRRIVRLYLNELAADFHSIHAQATALVTEAPEAQAGLAATLVRQQIRFWVALSGVELRLVFSRLGTRAPDPRGLVDAIEAMHAKIGEASASAAA